MKFVKRIIFIVILLLLSFFVYRLINPSAAKTLVQDVKTFSNDTLGTHFVVTTELEEIVVETWTILQESWIVLQETDLILEDTSILQEFDDEDALLLVNDFIEEDVSNDLVVVEYISWSSSVSTPPEVPTSPSKPSSPKKTTSSSSAQEERDLQDLLNNFSIY